MNKLFSLFTLHKQPKSKKQSDFSDFFTKSSRDKKRVINQILREANEEQMKVVQEYRRRTPVGQNN